MTKAFNLSLAFIAPLVLYTVYQAIAYGAFKTEPNWIVPMVLSIGLGYYYFSQAITTTWIRVVYFPSLFVVLLLLELILVGVFLKEAL